MGHLSGATSATPEIDGDAHLERFRPRCVGTRGANPRYVEGARALRDEEFGPLVEARATWTSSNGPMRGWQGWLGRRERSGDWMVEQAVHLWETLHDLTGSVPIRASGVGRKPHEATHSP